MGIANRLRRFAVAGLLTVALLPLSTLSGSAPLVSVAASDFCSRLGHSIIASSGAQMYCDRKTGVKPAPANVQAPRGGGGFATCPSVPGAPRRFGNNVDAGDPREDVNPACAQHYGQSETSIAAVNQYVVEAWNDATALSSQCGSPMYKEEVTGFGFSADGGNSFVDQGGLPNAPCAAGFFYQGDPAVETWQSGGASYFYIASLYVSFATSQSDIAMDVCKATGSGSAATLTCNPNPVIIATGDSANFDFLDKEYLSIDPARGRLYTSYTRFGQFGSPTFNGQIELAVCDIGTPSGGAGSGGGTAGAPVCFPGPNKAPYFVVAPGNPNCENEGSYPAVHQASGDVYVGWEFNVATELFNPACQGVPTQNMVAFVPQACLTLTPVSPCVAPAATKGVQIVSISAAMIPGYNRFPMQDFPRIAVSDPKGTVSIVWNDARMHPTADIYLQSFELGSLALVQKDPVRLNLDSSYTWKVLPALRYPTSDGLLDVSWYDRRIEGNPEQRVAYTDVYAAIGINPRIGSGGEENGNGNGNGNGINNIRVTSQATDWFAASSDIGPNFGDYTDNFIIRTTTGPTYTDNTLHVAWSDGRMGLPQPFTARFGKNGEQQ